MGQDYLQMDFVAAYLNRLHELDSIDVVELPGRQAAVPADNTLVFSMAPLSGFEQLPRSDEFLDRIQAPPHAIVRLGKLSLLAVVDEPFPRPLQRLVALQHDRVLEAGRILTDGRADGRSAGRLVVGREWLADRNGHMDLTVSRRHALLGAFGMAWMLQDAGSMNGTSIALEAGSGYAGGLLEGVAALGQPQPQVQPQISEPVPDFLPDDWPARYLEPFGPSAKP